MINVKRNFESGTGHSCLQQQRLNTSKKPFASPSKNPVEKKKEQKKKKTIAKRYVLTSKCKKDIF